MRDVCVKLALGIGKETHVKLLLRRRKVVAADDDCAGRETEVIGTFDFGATEWVSSETWQLHPPKHHAIQEDFELLERSHARAAHLDAVAGNGRENLRVPQRHMVHRLVPTVVAVALVAELRR